MRRLLLLPFDAAASDSSVLEARRGVILRASCILQADTVVPI